MSEEDKTDNLVAVIDNCAQQTIGEQTLLEIDQPNIENGQGNPTKVIHETFENQEDEGGNENHDSNIDEELDEEVKDTNQPEGDNGGDQSEQKISKNQLKRQKRAQMWESIKQKKKELKKEEKQKKKQERQEQMIENTQNCQPERKQKQQHSEPYKSNQQLRDEYSNKAKQGQPVILDMQFLDKLEDKEFKSLIKQLCYMQSSNKRATQPCRFMITSATPKLRKALLANNAENWGIEILDEHYQDIFPKENLVYLTGDTDSDLEELDLSTAYIIGGLVDHNRLKNITFNTASEQGIAVKRFPIQNYLKLEASSILACNHVFDIMVRRANGESWKDSLTKSIPIRKVVATIENGVEVPTEQYLKKLELMKKQQEEALQKKKLLQEQLDNVAESQVNNNQVSQQPNEGEQKDDNNNEGDEEEHDNLNDDSKIEQEQ